MKNKPLILLFFTMLAMSAYSVAFIADRQDSIPETPISHTLWD